MNAKRISAALTVSLADSRYHHVSREHIFYTPRTQTNELKDAVTVEILSPIRRRLPLLVSRVRPMNEPVLSVETVQMPAENYDSCCCPSWNFRSTPNSA